MTSYEYSRTLSKALTLCHTSRCTFEEQVVWLAILDAFSLSPHAGPQTRYQKPQHCPLRQHVPHGLDAQLILHGLRVAASAPDESV